MMMGMPGTDDAIQRCLEHKGKIQVGVHLSLTEGVPITAEVAKIGYMFSGSHVFRNHMVRNLGLVTPFAYQAMYHELEAQLAKAKSAGILVHHLNTHHNIHEFLPIMIILCKLGSKFGVEKLRVLSTQRSKGFKRLYRDAVNGVLRMYGLAYSNVYIDDALDVTCCKVFDSCELEYNSAEVLLHPDIDLDGRIYDRFYDSDKLRAVLQQVY